MQNIPVFTGRNGPRVVPRGPQDGSKTAPRRLQVASKTRSKTILCELHFQTPPKAPKTPPHLEKIVRHHGAPRRKPRRQPGRSCSTCPSTLRPMRYRRCDAGLPRVVGATQSPPRRPPKLFSQSPDPTPHGACHGGRRVIPGVRAIEANPVPHAGSSAAS